MFPRKATFRLDELIKRARLEDEAKAAPFFPDEVEREELLFQFFEELNDELDAQLKKLVDGEDG